MGAAPVLTILKNGEKIRSCEIQGEALLGRSEGCVIRLEDRAISRQHAVFRALPDGVQVEKKSEFAPLVVNGAECTQAVVREGDVISIGPYLMRVSVGQGQGGSQNTAPAASATPSLEPTAPAAGEATVRLTIGESGEPGDLNLGDAGSGSGLSLESPLGVPDSTQVLSVGDPSNLSGSIELDVGESQSTKLITTGDLEVKLVLPPGVANVDELVIDKEEISIGRGKNCDIVLNDKKVSRKNSIIVRAGRNYVLKDLGSVNGTFVNGEQVQERELQGDDKIRIGDVEMDFKAVAAGYSDKERDFLQVASPADSAEPMDSAPAELAPFDMSGGEGAVAGAFSATDGAAMAAPAGIATAGTQTSIPGIVGIGGEAKKNGSLLEKFRALPPYRRYMVIGLVGAFLYLFLDEEQSPPPKPKQATQQTAKDAKDKGGKKVSATFDQLSPELKRFVETQHELAFNHYKNKDYDKALYEVRKIFEHVEDYKNSREIERYAMEGQKKLQALAEEKRRKDEEARIKAKIAELVDEASGLMQVKKFEQAKEKFGEILAIEPENAAVAKWRRQIQDYEEGLRIKEQEEQVQAEVNRHGWEIMKEGTTLLNGERYLQAVDAFQKVLDIGASDPKLIAKAKAMMTKAKEALASRLGPLMEQGNAAEQEGNLTAAYKNYEKARSIDPTHEGAVAGINRIRGVLHDRAKAMYTEAILAESYSDFETAKKKFRACIETAPKDDVYYERAERKLARYFKKEVDGQ